MWRAAALAGFVLSAGFRLAAQDHGHDHGAAPAAGAAVAFQAQGARLGERAAVVPLLVADRHVVVPITLYSATGRKERITLELDLANPDVFTLHRDQVAWIDAPAGGDEGHPVSFSFVEGELLLITTKDIRTESDREIERRQMLMTIRHATELQEQKLKGRIGLGLLRHYRVDLDVSARELRLAPLDAESGAVGGSRLPLAGSSLLAVPVQGARTGEHVLIGSLHPESRVDPDFAKGRGAGPGESGPLVLDSAPPLDLTAKVAFRPKALAGTPPEGEIVPVAMTGTDLLATHQLTIDWTANAISLVAKQASNPSVPDRAFFVAEATGTPAALGAFLEAHRDSHFAREAAAMLMNLRLQEWGVSEEDLITAFRWLLDTMTPERRVDVALPVLTRLTRTPGMEEVAFRAGAMALEHSRAAVAIQNVYRIHRILGGAHLKAGNIDQAWRHLMSATFVKIPEDPQHTFEGAYFLGEVYEKQGRLTRAYSRYRAAARTLRVPSSLISQAEAAAARVRAGLPPEEIALLDEQ